MLKGKFQDDHLASKNFLRHFAMPQRNPWKTKTKPKLENQRCFQEV